MPTTRGSLVKLAAVAPPTTDQSVRLDKFLWCARFFKSRSQATGFVEAGRVRLRGAAVTKAHQNVRVGDVLTFPLGSRIRIVRVRALATRRGSAPVARLLYEELGAGPAAAADAGPHLNLG
jgi:ribosome-associated heat shock protein Hsp15